MKKNKIKIPKQFELGSRTIKVEIDNNLKGNTLGLAEYCANKIKILKKQLKDNIKENAVYFYKKEFIYYNENTITQEEMEYVYIHELIHWILYTMGNTLHSNERFVTIFSELLTQALKTSKYKNI